MSDQEPPKVPKRGEAAWKAVKEGVAERNEQARKLGQQERKAQRENAAALMRAAGAKRQARVDAR